jgi:hypothetical protein
VQENACLSVTQNNKTNTLGLWNEMEKKGKVIFDENKMMK